MSYEKSVYKKEYHNDRDRSRSGVNKPEGMEKIKKAISLTLENTYNNFID
jgi:hypothetical protein